MRLTIKSEKKTERRERGWTGGLWGWIFWCGWVPGQLMNTPGKATVHSSNHRKTVLEKLLKLEIEKGINDTTQLQVVPQRCEWQCDQPSPNNTTVDQKWFVAGASWLPTSSSINYPYAWPWGSLPATRLAPKVFRCPNSLNWFFPQQKNTETQWRVSEHQTQ